MGPTARQLSMSWQGRDIGKERERNRKRTTGFSLTSHVFGCVVRVSNAQVSNDIAREKEETHSPPKLMMLNVQRLAHPSLSDASHSPSQSPTGQCSADIMQLSQAWVSLSGHYLSYSIRDDNQRIQSVAFLFRPCPLLGKYSFLYFS